MSAPAWHAFCDNRSPSRPRPSWVKRCMKVKQPVANVIAAGPGGLFSLTSMQTAGLWRGLFKRYCAQEVSRL